MTEFKRSSDVSEKPNFGIRLLKWTGRLIYKAVLPILIVAGAFGFYKHQMDTRPQAERRPAERQARLVTVECLSRQTCAAEVFAMGTVRAATEVSLVPEVTGIVVYVDPSVLPGGLVSKGQILYRIDSRDYETIVQQRQSELARAELALQLELGNQTVARQEYEMLGEMVQEQDKQLVLRIPHLEQARQAVAAAQAALDKARLDVQRCTIRTPFNAVIKTKAADIGARVSATTPLTVLTGTDEYWVEALVPTDELRWIQFPQGDIAEGSPVTVTNPTAWEQNQSRGGRVLRLLDQLEEAGRMAQILISVSDPLGLAGDTDVPPLLIGSYVRVRIEGIAIPDVVILPRAYLRDGGSVWVMNEQDKLEIRTPQIVFRGRESLYVSQGLSDGDRVISSDLAAPVEGMPLRIDDTFTPEAR